MTLKDSNDINRVCSCFLVGFGVTAISIIRITSLSALTASRNPTYDFAAPGFWSLVEVYCSIICCCMPAFAGFLHRLWGYTMRGQWSERLRGSLSSKASESRLMKNRHYSIGGEGGEKRSLDDILGIEKLETGNGPKRPVNKEVLGWDYEDMESGPRPAEVMRLPSEANVLEMIDASEKPVITSSKGTVKGDGRGEDSTEDEAKFQGRKGRKSWQL